MPQRFRRMSNLCEGPSHDVTYGEGWSLRWARPPSKRRVKPLNSEHALVKGCGYTLFVVRCAPDIIAHGEAVCGRLGYLQARMLESLYCVQHNRQRWGHIAAWHGCVILSSAMVVRRNSDSLGCNTEGDEWQGAVTESEESHVQAFIDLLCRDDAW